MDCADPYAPSVKSEPDSPAESGDEEKGELPYTDIDISLLDIKQECAEYSRKSDQLADLSRLEDSVLAIPTAALVTSGREAESMIKFTAEKNFKLQTHAEEKSFSCSQCTYSCNQKGSLKMHMFTHSGEKPFSCSKCNFLCNNKGSLNRHMLTHSGVKPFACSKCIYSCNQKGSIKRHMLVHSKAKPFSCKQCAYSCKQKFSLKMHMLTHSGEKPFSCSKCIYSCNQKGSLKRHMITHSGEKYIHVHSGLIHVTRNAS